MQTAFSLAQLADPKIAASDKIVRACVHCGFCTATCPTYVLLGDERDSPRGRIYLIKDMLENDRPATADVVPHIDRCLSCLACMTTCPSGVHYMHLVDHAREHVEKTYRRPFFDRAMRAFLAAVMPRPGLLRAAQVAAWPAKPLAPLFEAIGLKPLAAAIRLAPAQWPRRRTKRGLHPASGERKGRVALLAGCANEALAPSITQATIRLLNRHGIDVTIAQAETCCGSLEHHMGREAAALSRARRNIDAWTALAGEGGLDAILVTVSGCGTTVKDYGFMLREDAAYAEKAAAVSALARDVSEYLATLALVPTRETGLRVAYHAACSLQHGQRVVREPKALLAALGFTVADVPEGHLCCGSAGTYNILQPTLANQLRARKIGHIESTRPDVIAAGNIGCLTQIASGTSTPAVHVVELADWATGGPLPAGLHHRVDARLRPA